MKEPSDIVSLLKTILTPQILRKVHELAVPPAGITPQQLFNNNTLPEGTEKELKDLLFHSVFIPLSRIQRSDYPDNDMLQLLPPPDDVEFPVQATGLVVLLDQATRMILKGKNARWTNDFFDSLAYQVAKQLCELPDHLRVDNPQRWMDLNHPGANQGYPRYSWEDGMLRAQYLHVPFVHSEDETAQKYAKEFSESRRIAVENRYNKRDPSRTDPIARAIENDLDGFPRLIRGQIPPSYFDAAEAGGFAEYFWFRCQINRAHLPPLRKFGRYPWRNGAVGRESTQEEKEYLLSIRGFAQVRQDVADAIAIDVRQGIWTPLA